MGTDDTTTGPRTARSRRALLSGVAAALATGTVAAGSAPATAAPSASNDETTLADDALSPVEDALSPAGSLELDGLSEVVVDASGEVAYGALRSGFAAFDVRDPTEPTLLAERSDLLADHPNGPINGVFDVKVSGDRLLVVGPNGGLRSDEVGGALVFDVSDPADPVETARYLTSHAIHNSFLDGEHAYLTGSGLPEQPLIVVDVGGEAPEELVRWSPAAVDEGWRSGNGRTCHDVYVQDGTAYVAYWDAGTWLLDVSDPANPAFVARVGGMAREDVYGQGFEEVVELPGNAHYVQPNAAGDRLAVGKEAWDRDDTAVEGGPGGIELWDVSDPANAERYTILAPPPLPDGVEGSATAHNFAWDGDRLYTSWYNGGVRVYDLSDPASPRLLAEWAAPKTAAFWTAVPTANGFVGSSYHDPSLSRTERRNGGGARLFAFAAVDDGDARPAPTMDPVELPDETATTGAPTTTAGTTRGGTAGTGSTDPPTSPDASAGDGADGGGAGSATSAHPQPDDPIPGFGPGVAAAGGVLAGLALRWRRVRDE